MSTEFDGYGEEFLQRRLEEAIIEQCELHNWATAISVANPLNILILLEEENQDIDYNGTTNNVIELKEISS